MQIESHALGTIEVADEKVIEFPAGLPGFEDSRRFALVHEDGAEKAVFLLQSADDPSVTFSITTPENLGVNYEFPLSDEDVTLLQLERAEDALVAIIVRKGDEADSPASAGLRANFMAPLVINVSARRGMQKVINRLGFDVTLRAEA